MLSSDHFISLDVAGVCYVWSLEHTAINRRRSVSSSNQPMTTDAIRNGIRQSRAESFDKRATNRKTHQQTVVARHGDRIRCVTPILSADGKKVKSVIFGTELGQFKIYEWHNNALSPEHDCATNIGPIHSIVSVTSNFLVVISRTGHLWLMSTKTMSPMPLDLFSNAEPNSRVIGIHVQSDQTFASTVLNRDRKLLVVFENRVMLGTFRLNSNGGVLVKGSAEIFAPWDNNRITCSVLSDDREYLILGTERGIVVFDVRGKQVILRSSVCDRITCVDIHSLDSGTYKYLLMCSTWLGEKLCYVYGMESDGQGSLMQWASNRMGSPINDKPLLGNDQLNTWLQGGRMFAVTELDVESHHLSFTAVDSRGLIHRKCSVDEFRKSVRIQCGNGALKIQAFATCGEMVVVGCKDGGVYDSRERAKVMQLQGPVTFLRCFSEQFLVAGTKYGYRMSHYDREVRSEQVAEAYLLGDDRFLLLVKVDTSFEVSINYKCNLILLK